MSRAFASTAPLLSCLDQSQFGDLELTSPPLTVRMPSDSDLQSPNAPQWSKAISGRSTTGRKFHSRQNDLSLARGLHALTACVEDLDAQLASRRSAAASQEASLARALQRLSEAAAQSPPALALDQPELELQPGQVLETSPATPSTQSASSDIEERLREVLDQIRGGPEDQPGQQETICTEARQEGDLEGRLLDMLVQMKERLESHQDRVEGRILEQRRHLEGSSETRVIRDLEAAVRSLQSPKASPRLSRGLTHHKPHYVPSKDKDGRLYEYPEVQIALKVYQVSNVDTANLTFEADFLCTLDWRDTNVQGIPSDELPLLDWEAFFNPHLQIDNAKAGGGWLDGIDEIPRRYVPRRLAGHPRPAAAFAHVHSEGRSQEEAREIEEGAPAGPWLRKTMRFRGTLTMNEVDLTCFPFDIQALPVRLKATCSCSNAAGTPIPELQEGVLHSGPSHKASLEVVYNRTEARLRGQGHRVVPGADDSLLEYDITRLASGHPEPHRGDIYTVGVIVARPMLGSHFWDLVIMNLLVILASAAFFDTAAPELSSRMSISLTIILALAAYTSARPAPIEKAPYTTLHDWCAKMSMLLVTGISAQNVFATVMCGGQDSDAPPYMVAEFEGNREVCGVGWCKSRVIDCRSLLVFLASLLALLAYTVVWLVRRRRHAAYEVWDLPPEVKTGSATSAEGGGPLAERPREMQQATACTASPMGGATKALATARARGGRSRAGVPTPRSPPRTPLGRPQAAAMQSGPAGHLQDRSLRDASPVRLGRSYQQLA